MLAWRFVFSLGRPADWDNYPPQCQVQVGPIFPRGVVVPVYFFRISWVQYVDAIWLWIGVRRGFFVSGAYSNIGMREAPLAFLVM